MIPCFHSGSSKSLGDYFLSLHDLKDRVCLFICKNIMQSQCQSLFHHMHHNFIKRRFSNEQVNQPGMSKGSFKGGLSRPRAQDKKEWPPRNDD